MPFETAPYHMIRRSLLILFTLPLLFLACCSTVYAESPAELYKIGLAYSDKGDYEDALKTFEQAIEKSPDSTLLWLNKGNTLTSLGRYQEALDAFNNVTRIDFTNKDVWYPRGVSYSGLGNYEMALHAFDKVIRYYPDNSLAYHKKGDALMALARYDEAIQAYDEEKRVSS
nr:tetratricopeptide repeat protein [uncultured Methanospirillum sp.]